jgi:hypothetical protein
MAQTIAKTRLREQRPHTFDRAVEAIGEYPPDPIRRLVLERGALKLLIGLGQGGSTRLLSIAQIPDHPATDNRGQIHLVGETVTVLLVGQEVYWQW